MRRGVQGLQGYASSLTYGIAPLLHPRRKLHGVVVPPTPHHVLLSALISLPSRGHRNQRPVGAPLCTRLPATNHRALRVSLVMVRPCDP